MFKWLKETFFTNTQSLLVSEHPAIAVKLVKIMMIWDLAQYRDYKLTITTILDLDPEVVVKSLSRDVTLADLLHYFLTHVDHPTTGSVLDIATVKHARKLPHNIDMVIQLVEKIADEYYKGDVKVKGGLNGLLLPTKYFSIRRKPKKEMFEQKLEWVDDTLRDSLRALRSADFKLIVDVETATPREIDYFLFQLDFDHTSDIRRFNPHLTRNLPSFEFFKPTTEWGYGGPYFDQHKLEIVEHENGTVEVYPVGDKAFPAAGKTRLIAACRSVLFNTYHHRQGRIPFEVVSQREVFKDVE